MTVGKRGVMTADASAQPSGLRGVARPGVTVAMTVLVMALRCSSSAALCKVSTCSERCFNAR